MKTCMLVPKQMFQNVTKKEHILYLGMQRDGLCVLKKDKNNAYSYGQLEKGWKYVFSKTSKNSIFFDIPF